MLGPIRGIEPHTSGQDWAMASRKRSLVDTEAVDKDALVLEYRVGLALIAPGPS
jgi:hypothetical protein